MNRKHIWGGIILYFILFTFAACGTDQKLEEYKSNMETFYSDISQYDAIINSIDVTSETSTEELLAALDHLNEQFLWMASLPVPEEFSNIESVAQEAGEYMSAAVSMFHQAYEGESFDRALADSANEYYIKANQHINYILSILHGTIQEGGNVEMQPD